MSDSAGPEEKKDEKDWKKIITRHLVAWVVLVIFCMWIWSMIKPVLPENASSSMVSGKKEESKESTTKSSVTTIREKQEQKPSESTVKEKIPTVVTTTEPIVTTTAPIIVNGERVNNPLIGANVKRVKIIVNGLNVRAAPNMGGAVIGALRRNEIVTVLGYRGEWLYVKIGENKAGFIKADTKYEKPVR